jgi:hypothetical protein
MDKLHQIYRKQSVLSELVNNQDIVKLIQKNWDFIFGKLAAHLRFGYFKKGVLFIYSDNPMWVNEIDFYKADLLKKINDMAHLQLKKNKAVKELKVSFQKKGIEKTEEEKNLPKKLPLKDLIVLENRLKREKGYTLCEKCEAVYTPDKYCVFCKLLA